jgi:hypothetical protein
MRHETCASATGDACAKNSNASAAKATCVASAKAAAHMASTKAAAHMAAATTTTTTAASGLCTRYKKASGEHRACQQHYHSSCHDFSPLRSADFPPQALSDVGVSRHSEHQRRDRLEMGMISLVSTQFLLSQSELSRPNARTESAYQIETSTKRRIGSLGAIPGWQTCTGGYRFPEAAQRLEPQSGYYAHIVASTDAVISVL